MTKVMIIRHAEKPGEGHPSHGVNAEGHHDRHDLTVVGWQRAGALARYFAPWGPECAHAGIARPASIFASAAVHGSPSLRSQHTVEPLAALIGVPVQDAHPEGDEIGVAKAALAAPSPVLIAWHHKKIRTLVAAIAGVELEVPDQWPDERFDMVWVLDRDGPDGRWTFSQVAQLLLPGDRPEPFA